MDFMGCLKLNLICTRYCEISKRMLFDIKEMSGCRAWCPLTQHCTYFVQSVTFQEEMSELKTYDYLVVFCISKLNKFCLKLQMDLYSVLCIIKGCILKV